MNESCIHPYKLERPLKLLKSSLEGIFIMGIREKETLPLYLIKVA